MKTYVLYHASCFDGFCAAWVLRKYLKIARGNYFATDDIQFIPVQYGEAPPEIEPGSFLYILDFSYPYEQYLKWVQPDSQQQVSRLVVIDHHLTATDDIKKLQAYADAGLAGARSEAYFDLTKSGGRLAWDGFFFQRDMVPGLVLYTEDRDLWKWALPGSREVNACLRSYPCDFELWDTWGDLTALQLLEEFLEPGKAILRREKQIIDQHVKHARETTIAGHKVLEVNATVLTSEIAGELAVGRPFGACYFDRQDAKRVYSLRSQADGEDVAAIAQKFGGDGHKHAAGFELSVGPGIFFNKSIEIAQENRHAIA